MKKCRKISKGMKLRIARKICKYMGHGYPISNIGRLKEAIRVWERACKIYCDDLCERSRCGMCYHKYDHKAQVKNDFKYSECETLKMFRKDMED